MLSLLRCYGSSRRLLLAIFFFLPWLGGCSCGGGPNLPVGRPNLDDLLAAQPPAPNATSSTPAKPKEPPRLVSPDEETPPPPAPAAKPKRPAIVTSWTSEQALEAARDGDPQIVAFAQHLMRSAPNSEATWKLLTQLLTEQRTTAATAVPLQGRHPTDDDEEVSGPVRGLTAALIPFLGSKDYPPAQEVLAKVLRGEQATDVPQSTANDLILKAWKDLPPAIAQRQFLALLTEPEKWTSGNTPGWDAVALQRKALEVVSPTATPQLRAQLARYVIAPETAPATRTLLAPVISKLEPANLEALLVLHASPVLTPTARAQFRDFFSPLNTTAYDQLLGISPLTYGLDSSAVGTLATTGNPDDDYELARTQAANRTGTALSSQALFSATPTGPAAQVPSAYLTVRQLWSGPFVQSVADELLLVHDIGASRELMQLACNLPQTAVRKNLRVLLERHWQEGVTPFQTAKLTFESIHDPGFLVVVKSMPREKPQTTAATSGSTRDQQARQAWTGASEKYVRTLLERFGQAARLSSVKPASSESASGANDGAQVVTAAKPVTPESEAEAEGAAPQTAEASEENTQGLQPFRGLPIVAEHHLLWPEQWPAELKQMEAPQLVVHYVRLEGEERFNKVRDFYKRQLNDAWQWSSTRGDWLDSFQTDAASGRSRTVDVLISREPRTRPGLANSPEPLTVECLWIEVPTPG